MMMSVFPELLADVDTGLPVKLRPSGASGASATSDRHQDGLERVLERHRQKACQVVDMLFADLRASLRLEKVHEHPTNGLEPSLTGSIDGEYRSRQYSPRPESFDGEGEGGKSSAKVSAGTPYESHRGEGAGEGGKSSAKVSAGTPYESHRGEGAGTKSTRTVETAAKSTRTVETHRYGEPVSPNGEDALGRPPSEGGASGSRSTPDAGGAASEDPLGAKSSHGDAPDFLAMSGEPTDEELPKTGQTQFRELEQVDIHTAFLMAKGWIEPDDSLAKHSLDVSATLAAASSPRTHTYSDGDQSAPVMCCGVRLPPRHEVLAMVTSQRFNIGVSFLIALNAFIIMCEVEMNGHKSAFELGYEDEDVTKDLRDDMLFWCDTFFNVAFSLELCLRVYALRWRFFKKWTDLFDSFLVTSGIIDSYLLPQLRSSVNLNFSFARLLRLARVVRVLRIARIMRVFSALRVICKTVASSVAALFWSMIFLVVIIVVNAIFLASVLEDFIQDEENDWYAREWVYTHYGSAFRSSYTMFEATLSGGWPNYARRLVEEVSGALAVYWMVYVMSVVFAVIRIITAIFLRETLKNADKDEEQQVAEDMRSKSTVVLALREMLLKSDKSGDGYFSQGEFDDLLLNREVTRVFHQLGVTAYEAEGLFYLLNIHQGEASVDEYLAGVLQLNNSGRSVDMVTLLYESWKIHRRIDDIVRRLSDRFGSSLELPPPSRAPSRG